MVCSVSCVTVLIFTLSLVAVSVWETVVSTDSLNVLTDTDVNVAVRVLVLLSLLVEVKVDTKETVVGTILILRLVDTTVVLTVTGDSTVAVSVKVRFFNLVMVAVKELVVTEHFVRVLTIVWVGPIKVSVNVTVRGGRVFRRTLVVENVEVRVVGVNSVTFHLFNNVVVSVVGWTMDTSTTSVTVLVRTRIFVFVSVSVLVWVTTRLQVLTVVDVIVAVVVSISVTVLPCFTLVDVTTKMD